MKITFLGGSGEVTGSCFLLEGEGLRFLVDCGMFQGGREAYAKNLGALQFDVRSLDFVLLTHAHLDHSGLLPRLAALGYRGDVFATSATVDLLHVMLLDSAHIQEKEAEWENRHYHDRHARRGYERAPLYTVAQTESCLRQLRRVEYDAEIRPHAGVRACFRDAGHILGSSIIELWLDDPGGTRKWVFSGDLGQPARPVLRDPYSVHHADVLLVESTYGNRCHKSMEETENELVGILSRTLKDRRGNVVMPAFSVGRTQEIVFVLADLVRRERLGPLDIYVDSPMALSATEITLRHQALLDTETQQLMRWQRENPQRVRVRFVQDVEESMSLNHIRGGAVIISASGMCEAGRIKYHLKNNLPRRECAIVITGFQAAGTLGRRLVEGAKTVSVFGEPVPVRASVHTVGGLSAHADRDALLDWLSRFTRPPHKTFVVHGEADTAHAFAAAVRQHLGWTDVSTPELGTRADI